MRISGMNERGVLLSLKQKEKKDIRKPRDKMMCTAIVPDKNIGCWSPLIHCHLYVYNKKMGTVELACEELFSSVPNLTDVTKELKGSVTIGVTQQGELDLTSCSQVLKVIETYNRRLFKLLGEGSNLDIAWVDDIKSLAEVKDYIVRVNSSMKATTDRTFSMILGQVYTLLQAKRRLLVYELTEMEVI